MDNVSIFKTYLYISKKKFTICVVQINDLKVIYKKEFSFQSESNELEFNKLREFLDDNILKLEKTLKNFIENIIIVLDTSDFFSIYLSVKNNNRGNVLKLENLSYSLKDARYQCEKTIENNKLIHMIIENYQIDNKNYNFLPEKLNCNNFSLDIKFICLPLALIKSFESSLEKYQISINQIICADYVKKFFKDSTDFFEKVRQITEGCNPNEVKFYNKNSKNHGFFEKFFNIFR